MPIAQSRMIALIDASREYEELFAKLTSGAVQLIRQTNDGKIDPAMLIHEFEDLVHALRPSPESVKAITAEAVHFKNMGRRNELNKARERRRRNGFAMGAPASLSIANEAALAQGPGASAPESLVPKGPEIRGPGHGQRSETVEAAVRYSAPTKADIEQASQEAFKARSEAIRQSLRDGTFVESMLKPSDPNIVEVETTPDPEGYDAAAAASAEDF